MFTSLSHSWSFCTWNLKRASTPWTHLGVGWSAAPLSQHPYYVIWNLKAEQSYAQPTDTFPCALCSSFHSCYIRTHVSVSLTRSFYKAHLLSCPVLAQCMRRMYTAHWTGEQRHGGPPCTPLAKVPSTGMDGAWCSDRYRAGIKKECPPCMLALTGHWCNFQSHVSISDHIRQ